MTEKIDFTPDWLDGIQALHRQMPNGETRTSFRSDGLSLTVTRASTVEPQKSHKHRSTEEGGSLELYMLHRGVMLFALENNDGTVTIKRCDKRGDIVVCPPDRAHNVLLSPDALIGTMSSSAEGPNWIACPGLDEKLAGDHRWKL